MSEALAIFLSFIFVLSAALIITGLMMPAMHVEHFWFFHRNVSIMNGIYDLVDSGQIVLGWLILFLSVLVPIAKSMLGFFISAFVRECGPILSGLISTFQFLGKWSLADVFVLAILVIVIDGQVLTVAELGPGIYAFGAGVLLSYMATMVLHSRAQSALRSV